MRHKAVTSAPIQVLDFDRREIKDPSLLAALEGLACHDDTALNYLEAEIEGREQLRGGYPRLAFDAAKKRLNLEIEMDGPRKLSRKELAALKEDLRGQITDGIGTGAFNELSAETTLTVALRMPLRLRFVQTEGAAWKPGKGAAASNQRKYAAAKRWIAQGDEATKSAPAKPARGKPLQASAAPASAKQAGKSLKGLFRLLSKVDRNNYIDQIKAELDAAGGDLSSVADRQLPYGNWTSPRLLKLLLDARLNPELLDEKGYTQLYTAAGNVECVRLLLARGVDVNRQSEDVNRSTALMRAAFLGNVNSIETLLAAGADPNLRGAGGVTALGQIKMHTSNPEKVRALLEAVGAKQ